MSVTLLSGGCSFAYGYGLNDRDGRYSSLIAKNRGWDLVDVSGGAFANETIATAVVSGLNKLLKAGKDPSSIVVVVGWTSQSRMEYFDVSSSRMMTLLTVPPDYYVHPSLQKIGKLERVDIASAMWHNGYGYYKYLHAFNYVDSFCHLHNIKLIHIQNLDIFPVKMPNEQRPYTDVVTNDLITEALSGEAQKRLKKLLIQKTFAFLANRNKDIDDSGHPQLKSHLLWADYVGELIS